MVTCIDVCVVVDVVLFCVQRSSEEEDIDRVLAKMKSSGGRGNLLSVVAVST